MKNNKIKANRFRLAFFVLKSFTNLYKKCYNKMKINIFEDKI